MKFCDITLSYNEASGGVRTYLDHKREYILNQTEHEHILIIPGEKDTVTINGKGEVDEVACPLVPGHAPYRMFWRPGPIAEVLDRCKPDVIELGSYYVSAWSSFSYRHRQEISGHPVIVGGYFHTDVPRALVSGPLENAISETIGEWSHVLEEVGYQLTAMLSTGVEAYFHSVFDRCDLKMASSEQQVSRLNEYGVSDVHVIPLGVDLKLFHPDKRSQEIRYDYGINPDDICLIYGGRLNQEKDVLLLVEAYRLIADKGNFHLLMIGEGPLHEELDALDQKLPRMHILPYETEEEKYAQLIASADIYVSAGPYETFGISIAEAQAADLPVVGVKSGALTERVNQQTGRLGPPHDAQAFARNIIEVARNLDSFDGHNRAYAEEHYSWNVGLAQSVALYEQEYLSRSI